MSTSKKSSATLMQSVIDSFSNTILMWLNCAQYVDDGYQSPVVIG